MNQMTFVNKKIGGSIQHEKPFKVSSSMTSCYCSYILYNSKVLSISSITKKILNKMYDFGKGP